MSENNLISTDSIKKMNQALETLRSIDSIEIENQEQYDNAAEIQRDIASAYKNIEADRKETLKPIDEKRKSIQVEYKTVLDKLNNGKVKIGLGMTTWFEEQQRKIALEQRKREAEAEEKRRKAEEQARKEREKAEEYERQGKAELAEKAHARADEKIDVAVTTVAPIVEQKKAEGVSYRVDYQITVTNSVEAIEFLLKSTLTSHLVAINEGALKSMIKSSKGKMVIPGVNVREIKKQVVRSK